MAPDPCTEPLQNWRPWVNWKVVCDEAGQSLITDQAPLVAEEAECPD